LYFSEKLGKSHLDINKKEYPKIASTFIYLIPNSIFVRILSDNFQRGRAKPGNPKLVIITINLKLAADPTRD
jgi:hypothetical protein